MTHSRQAILNTYRTILRYSNPLIDGRRPRASTLSGPFAKEIQQMFHNNKNVSPEVAAELGRQASELATHLQSNFTHAMAVFDAGWCLHTTTADHVKASAGYVGLDMPVLFDVDSIQQAEASYNEGPETTETYANNNDQVRTATTFVGESIAADKDR